MARPVSTQGRCPKCGSYDYSHAPGVWRRAICLDCETVYIRITGCEGFRVRGKGLSIHGTSMKVPHAI